MIHTLIIYLCICIKAMIFGVGTLKYISVKNIITTISKTKLQKSSTQISGTANNVQS